MRHNWRMKTRTEPRPVIPAHDLALVLTLPVTLDFLSWKDVVSLGCVNKEIRHRLTSETEGYWKTLCDVFGKEHGGLFIPPRTWEPEGGFRRIFFDHLWPTRTPSECRAAKIQVSVRFRPGDQKPQSLFLPLNQLIKMFGGSATPIKAEPIEFLDPLTNIVMRQPVRLPTSGRVMERSVITHQLKFSAVDPFTNQPLTEEELEPLPELQAKIEQWQVDRRKLSSISFDSEKIRNHVLTHDINISPEMMATLLEAQILERVAKQSTIETQTPLPFSNHPAHNNDDSGDEDNNNGGNGNGNGNANGVQGAGRVMLLNPASLDPADFGNVDFVENDDEMQDPSVRFAANADQIDPRDSPFGNASQSRGPSVADRYLGWERPETSAKVVTMNSTTVTMHTSETGLRKFNFPFVFNEKSEQYDVYTKCARPAVVSVLNNINSCVMCYGQTGSGKTYTTFGPQEITTIADSEIIVPSPQTTASKNLTMPTIHVHRDCGIVFRVFADIFEAAQLLAMQQVKMSVVIQYAQIYLEKVTCLLTGNSGRVTNHGNLRGAQRIIVNSLPETIDVLKKAEANKQFAATKMNARSSRAHTVLIITLTKRQGNDEVLSQSTLHIVDLAGSERIHKSGVVGQRLQEAVHINNSLLVLGKCITALVNQSAHVPFLESSLTRLLRPAFGGASRTTAIVNCHMGDLHGVETLNSLRFGERCAVITNELQAISSSFDKVLHTIDHALELCASHMATLESRGQTHLQAYVNLKHRHQDLTQRRREIVAVA